MRALLGAVVVLAAVGCGSYSGIAPPGGGLSTTPDVAGDPGGFGATVGGVKDIGQARAIIEAGGVPDPGLVSPEGLFSEHDFPAEGGACTDLFCARPAYGRHLLRETQKPTAFVHVGMLSGLKADWKRPPADLMVVVDKGGSMAGDLAETLDAIAVMVKQLRPDDRFGMVVFDDTAKLHIALDTVVDLDATLAKVRAVHASGGFAGVLDGAKLGYDALAPVRADGRTSRLMMFACSIPPVSDARFDALVKEHAAAGTGTSFFGILLGGDYSSVGYFSSKHGGNAFFLNTFESIKTVFDTDLDLIITPLAYDLAMQLKATGAKVKRVWGLPQAEQKLEAATLFASRNKGAIVLELEADENAEPSSLVTFDLSYRPTLKDEPTNGSATLVAETKGGVRKAAAVVNLADGLVAALTKAKSDRAAAKEAVEALRVYLEAEAKALGDDADLLRDVKLLQRLEANLG